MSILQYFKKQRECLGHFQSPASMKALLPLWIQPYTFIHRLQPLLDTAMPHADINDFLTRARTLYAVACNTNTSACTLIIITCFIKRVVSLFAKFFSANALQ